jgi:hypothetical protein
MDASEMLTGSEIPECQMQIVGERLEEYKKNPGLALDFEYFMNEIEQDL